MELPFVGPIDRCRRMQVLIKTDVTKYLEFKAVDGSFVLNGPRIEKVPITGMEAFRSPLMGLFEKRRAAKFFRRAIGHACGEEYDHTGNDRSTKRNFCALISEAAGLG